MESTSPKASALMVIATCVVLAGPCMAQEPDRQEVLAWFNQARQAEDAGRYGQAAALYEKVVKESPRIWGEESKNHATVLANLGNLYKTMGQYDRAEPLQLRSLKIREDKLGGDHPDTSQSLNNLATLYHAMRQYAKAESYHLRNLKLREEKFGPDHLDTAQTLNNLGAMYKEMGQNNKAEPLYLRSLRIKEARLGPDDPDTAQTLNNLGNLYSDAGQYARAEPLFQRSLKIKEARLGPDHPDTSVAINNLAILYHTMGQFKKAEPLFQRSLKIKEDRLGPDHTDTALALSNLANLYRDMLDYAKAEPLHQRSLKIRETRLGPDHPETAGSLNNLANVYKDMREYAKAEPLYLRSLKIYEAKRGSNQPETAAALNNLALLYQEMGQYARARPLYERSLNIREATLGPDHPDTAGSLNNLALLAAIEDKPAQAAARYDRCRRAVRQFSANVLPVLSETEQRAFFRNTDQGRFYTALSLGYRHPADADLAAHCATWLLNSKGIAQDTLAQGNLVARDNRDSVVGKSVQELTDVRRDLARLTMTPPRPGQEQAQRQARDELARREQDLARQLQQAGASVARSDPWVELTVLRQALKPGEVFVDIARFSVADFQARGSQKRWQPARYVAWVTRNGGPVQMVDLGEAEPIDEAVRRARRELEESPKQLKAVGEIEAEKALRGVLQTLADKVVKPLRKHIDAADTWILCPDGNLWLAPWAALPLDQKTYAIEKHTIRLVTSGRDLVKRPGAARRELSAPAIFADPDFDQGTQTTTNLFDSSRSLSGSLPLGKIPRLPGTAGEAEAISEKLGNLFGGEPELFLEGKATTAAFVKLQRPQALLLATHGFFLPDQELDDRERERLERDPGYKPANRQEDPFLRCGLLLAGCNKPDMEKDTGVLTGREILSTDLRGTKLVVLSACETGLGDVHNGEGVAGLRQAFQLAGAESVVASLWKVPDLETALLMTGFFDALSKGQDRPQALRQSQLRRLAERRDKFGAAHPYFWAAFSLTGAAEALERK